MFDFGLGWQLIAQAAETVAKEPAGNPPSFFSVMGPPILMMVVLYYLFILGPERKKTQKHRDMLTALKKNDRVQTIGGWYGIVASVNAGTDEVVLKIDEDKDVKIRIDKASIRRVVSASKEEPATT